MLVYWKSYICCMFVSCVNHVTVLNAAFCMTCSLLMLVEDARGDHINYIHCHCPYIPLLTYFSNQQLV